MPLDTDVTRLLLAWSDGTQAAGGPLMDAVYDELRRLARGYLVRERRNHSLPATALVHEAYLKLVDQRRVQLAEPRALLRRGVERDAPAARGPRAGAGRLQAGRGDHGAARRRRRGGRRQNARPDLALDAALEKLAALDPRQARLVELRFFGGLTTDEAAVVLDVAAITVKRDWAMARTWLYRELGGSS